MANPDKKSIDRREVERRRGELARVQEEITRIDDDVDRATVKSKIMKKDIIGGGEHGGSGRAGVSRRRPGMDDMKPTGLVDGIWETMIRIDLDRLASKEKFTLTDKSRVKRRLDGAPGSFKWLFKGLDSFNKERMMDELKELEARADKSEELVYLQVKDALFGLTQAEEKRLSYVGENPGTGLQEFEKTRRMILEEQLRRTLGGNKLRGCEWIPTYVPYDENTQRVKRVIKLMIGGEAHIPDAKKDEVRADALKVLSRLVKEGRIDDASLDRANDMLEMGGNTPASVSLGDLGTAVRGPFEPGITNITVSSEDRIPVTSDYFFVSTWDLMGSKEKAAFFFYKDNY
ncbi:MAG: hypothetical protein NTU61_00905, partial [Candidatus Altiarchaeota archaeon]|nr:hypothetical protein [Candidatus Altiarchaeota archaeon]